MAINETKKDFGLKLLNYYSDSMKIYSKSFDTESKLFAFNVLLKESSKTLNALCSESINTPRFNK